jgi:hypothetical protein
MALPVISCAFRMPNAETITCPLCGDRSGFIPELLSLATLSCFALVREVRSDQFAFQ